MKRLLLIFLNPFLLALLASILVLTLFPIYFPKYEVKEIESDKGIAGNTFYTKYFDDIDNDENSETIFAFYNSVGKAGIAIYKGKNVLEQWGFHGTFNFISNKNIILTGDRDGNGIKELYIFTISKDSIFLHCIENFNESQPTISNRFIASCGTSNGRVDPSIIRAEMEDLNNDGIKELIFGIGAGFSIFPRQVFAYDIAKDHLYISPQSSYNIMQILQIDIDGDSIREIIPWGYACCNVHDSTVKFHDESCWLMVLNPHLQFLFEPIEFKGKYSNLTPLVLNKKKGNSFLTVLFCPPTSTGDSAQLLKFDCKGKIVDVKKVSNTISSISIIKTNRNENLILVEKNKEAYELLDTCFSLLKVIKTENALPPIIEDIDLDGFDEVLTVNYGKRRIYIYRYDLTNPVEFKFEGNSDQAINYSIKKQKGKKPQLAFQYGTNFYLCQYGLNPKYSYRFGIYAFIYFGILLFTLLVRKTQRIQIQKKQEVEKKITELQLQIVRNQLDPHFSMNAINSIIASIHMEEKEEAREHLMYFSRLHRSMLLSADQIIRSLKDELDFTKNYLALEKFRFKDRFDYMIEVDPAVNLEIQIPKMILQIHVENAVKHGLHSKLDGGMVTIRCLNEDNRFVMEIEDNGVGREYSALNNQKSTGKGQAVMDQFIELYNKYNRRKISSIIIDLFDDENKAIGTKVKIFIANDHENKRG